MCVCGEVGTWPVVEQCGKKRELYISPMRFVASVRIRELGRNGIFKKEYICVCVNLRFVEQRVTESSLANFYFWQCE